jgi:N-acetylglucosamine-6-phosphate deacetylase
MKIITGATLIHPHGQQREGTLLIEGNRIRTITTDPPGSLLLNQEDVEIYSGEGCYLTPGLVELHFNGALGCNLNRTSIGEIQQLLQRLPAFGITSVLFTVITSPLTDMISAIHTLEEAIHHRTLLQSRPLGIHLEGPFISPQFRGAHPPQDIRALNMDELTLLVSPMVKMITLAPETDPEGEAIAALTRQGIRVSIGHSNATHAEIMNAIGNGACSVTHLYNAMRPFHHREPGIIGAALVEDALHVQLIADGAHVHPEAIKLVLRTKRPGQIMVTSDASPAAGMPEGAVVHFAGQDIVVQRQKALNQEGALAGSSMLVHECIRNLVHWGLCDFAQAVQFATLNPANFLGEEGLGRLEVGCMADLVLWNKKTLDVEATFINGQSVYQRQATPTARQTTT